MAPVATTMSPPFTQGTAPSSVQADVIAGLVALGYSERDAAAAARNIPPDATAAEGIRIALRYRN